MKTLIVLSGIPGSGKSTWTKEFVEKAEDGTVAVVSADLNRLAIGGSYDNFEHEDEVWKKVYDDILLYAFNDKIQYVIVDNTSISNKARMRYANQFEKYYNLEMIIFRIPFYICWLRNKERAKCVPDEAMERMYNYWQEPSEEVKAKFKIKEIY